MTAHHQDLAVLTAAGSALVLETSGPGLPAVLHWGADPGGLGDPHDLLHALTPGWPVASVDQPVSLRLVPQQIDGWTGRPGITGHRDGTHPHLRLLLSEPVATGVTDTDGSSAAGGHLRIHSTDPVAGLTARTDIEMDPFGVIRIRHDITNDGPGVFTLDSAACLLPVGDQAQPRRVRRRGGAVGHGGVEGRGGRGGCAGGAGSRGTASGTAGTGWDAGIGGSGEYLRAHRQPRRGRSLVRDARHLHRLIPPAGIPGSAGWEPGPVNGAGAPDGTVRTLTRRGGGEAGHPAPTLFLRGAPTTPARDPCVLGIGGPRPPTARAGNRPDRR
ncbi:glycoside hydrolase family 36 N-terminal domain-containing protein [Streptomyces sp. NPDC057592]|uniref:glycoside hydrolase family 36 N-terminal domain-containing protein n=1 Tax=unclassified Streptomyces TaxID=2593676 RepID=UPI0036AE7B94